MQCNDQNYTQIQKFCFTFHYLSRKIRVLIDIQSVTAIMRLFSTMYTSDVSTAEAAGMFVRCEECAYVIRYVIAVYLDTHSRP